MPDRLSAGILVYRGTESGSVQVLIAHMGGPFWHFKDEGAWSIPKGEHEPGDDAFAAACREFEEELGNPVPGSEFTDLGTVRQPSGKLVRVWATRGDFDPATAISNTFEMEWPRGSGRMQRFPEVDRAQWFDVAVARTKLVNGQVPFLDTLVALLRRTSPTG